MSDFVSIVAKSQRKISVILCFFTANYVMKKRTMRDMIPLCSQLIVPDEIDDLIHIVMAQLIAAGLRHPEF